MYDIAIIGGGPAALSAGIYGARSGHKTVIFEKMFTGGQVAKAFEVENYPGLGKISGVDLCMKFSEQTANCGCEFIYAEVTSLELEGEIKKITAGGKEYEAKTVILAMGANSKTLKVEGEAKFKGKGVSYCATCDGAFFKGKDAAVVGGGNTAVDDAIYLSKFCNKVYLIHRRDSLRADTSLQNILFKNEKIEVLWNKVVKKISGSNKVEEIVLSDVNNNMEETLKTDGVFIAIGVAPQSGLVKENVGLTDDGYIITNKFMQTNIAGVYSAGDIRDTVIRQIITAVSDGAIAATMAARHIMEG